MPWRIFCSHGYILFYVARHPGCTIQGIADALVLTPRTVWGLIGDLKQAGLVKAAKLGRRHQYSINEEGRIPDPLLAHLTMEQLVEGLTR